MPLQTRILLFSWLLLLLHISGSHSIKWNIFKIKSTEPQEGEVRLAGSLTAYQGRVEIYHNGQWGTICDDGWDLNEAQVVCRQLHFSGAKLAVQGGMYGEGSGPIWLDDMDCEGTENFLSNCSFKDWALTDCTHKEDAGVVCEGGLNETIINANHMLDHSLGLSDSLGQLFDSRERCDVHIVAQSPPESGQESGTSGEVSTVICAHKFILSLFPRFNVSDGTSNVSVVLRKACHPHFENFVRYMYTRRVSVSMSSAQCLHQLASEFGMTQLMVDVGRLFTKLLPEDSTFRTQVSLYEYSVDTGDLLLQENCLQYLAWNFQNLTTSPVWSNLSPDLLGALLSRSDLVVADEAFVVTSLESWMAEKGSSIGLERQVDLLGHIRFPMVSAEKLHDLPFTSALYKTHETLYLGKLLKGFQFHILPYDTMKQKSGFKEEDNDYKPRIYTAEPWSNAVDSNAEGTPQQQPIRQLSQHRGNRYGNPYGGYHHYVPTVIPIISTFFRTPAHNSMIFKNNMINWQSKYVKSQRECKSAGYTCESVPAAILSASGLGVYQQSIRFSNRLLLMCQGRYICHIQDFKNDMAYISVNGSHALTYPCPDDKYTYHFVVRPEYI